MCTRQCGSSRSSREGSVHACGPRCGVAAAGIAGGGVSAHASMPAWACGSAACCVWRLQSHLPYGDVMVVHLCGDASMLYHVAGLYAGAACMRGPACHVQYGCHVICAVWLPCNPGVLQPSHPLQPVSCKHHLPSGLAASWASSSCASWLMAARCVLRSPSAVTSGLLGPSLASTLTMSSGSLGSAAGGCTGCGCDSAVCGWMLLLHAAPAASDEGQRSEGHRSMLACWMLPAVHDGGWLVLGDGCRCCAVASVSSVLATAVSSVCTFAFSLSLSSCSSASCAIFRCRSSSRLSICGNIEAKVSNTAESQLRSLVVMFQGTTRTGMLPGVSKHRDLPCSSSLIVASGGTGAEPGTSCSLKAA